MFFNSGNLNVSCYPSCERGDIKKTYIKNCPSYEKYLYTLTVMSSQHTAVLKIVLKQHQWMKKGWNKKREE